MALIYLRIPFRYVTMLIERSVLTHFPKTNIQSVRFVSSTCAIMSFITVVLLLALHVSFVLTSTLTACSLINGNTTDVQPLEIIEICF